MIKQEIKKRVLDTTLLSYRQGLFAGTSGNLSEYDPETGYMYITPSSYPYEAMTEDDIMVIALDGTIIEGSHRPSSEWRMHAAIYRDMAPEVLSVVHTHSPYATAFAVCQRAVPVILIEMVPFLGGEVPVADFAVPGTDDVGTNAVRVLKDRNACLMANHGVLAIGKTLAQAHVRAIYVEDAAKICGIANSMGYGIHTVPDEDVETMRNRGKKKK